MNPTRAAQFSGRRLLAVALLVTAGLTLGGRTAFAQCGEWELVSPHPHGRDLSEVVFGGGRFVAVGYSVTQTSVDGLSWDVVAHEGVHLNAVAWDGAAFVAVGDGGVILRSSDGLSWEQVPSPTAADLRGVAWGGGEYVAVGGEGVAIQSTSGVAWQIVTLPTVQKLRGVTYGTGTFYVFGDYRTLLTGYRSSWRAIDLSSQQFPGISSVAELGGRLFVTATSGKLFVYDGASWVAPAGTPCLHGGLVRQGAQLFAVSCYGPAPIFSSADGFVWTAEPGPDTWVQPRSVAKGGGRAVAVGAAGMQLARLDGQAWELVSGRVDTFHDVASNGQILVATAVRPMRGEGTGCTLYSSTDGREWTCRLAFGEHSEGRRVAWLGDRFVALVEDYQNYTRTTWSRDGVTWSTPQMVDRMTGLDVVQFKDRSLAFTGLEILDCPINECRFGPARVFASDDLGSWHLVGGDPSSCGLVSVATNGARIVAARCDPDYPLATAVSGFVTSEDGETWTGISIPEPLPAKTKLVWTGSKFVAAGGGVVMESPDGLSWEVISRSSRVFNNLAWTGSELVGSGMWGSFPFVASSRDGRAWSVTWPFLQPQFQSYLGEQPLAFDSESPIVGVAGTPRLQVAVGPQGTVLRRECVPEPTRLRRRLGRPAAGSQP